jgi:hypothetical protein
MKTPITQRILLTAMIMGLVLVLIPMKVSAQDYGRTLQDKGPAIDRNTALVLVAEPEQAMLEQRVELAIRESGYVQTSPIRSLRVGVPTVLVIRNEDIVRHGFTSPMLAAHMVRAEGEGIASYGKGIEGFYIDSGKTLVIRFPLESKGGFTFHCDLHPQMKGELFLFEFPRM